MFIHGASSADGVDSGPRFRACCVSPVRADGTRCLDTIAMANATPAEDCLGRLVPGHTHSRVNTLTSLSKVSHMARPMLTCFAGRMARFARNVAPQPVHLICLSIGPPITQRLRSRTTQFDRSQRWFSASCWKWSRHRRTYHPQSSSQSR